VAVVLTLVQTKQIRTNIHKRNNTKSTVQKIHNTVNTSTHITKTYTHYKTHTYTHPNIKKQVKTNTVQDTLKWNSHSIIKYPQYKVTLMYNGTFILKIRRNSLHFTLLQYKITSHKSRHFTPLHYISLHFKTKSLHIIHVSSLHFTTFHFTSKRNNVT